MLVLIIVLAIIVVLGIIAAVMYNGLVRRRERVDRAWSDIDVQLRRRYDLIPNLVETVKGYASHERETLDAVVSARNAGVSAHTVQEQADAENQLTGALRQLFALSENYPDLKANQNFLALQEELTGTEGRIAAARQFYNDAVRDYNTTIASFPQVVFAGMFGFRDREYFEIEDSAARAPVDVDFGQSPSVGFGGTSDATSPAPPAVDTQGSHGSSQSSSGPPPQSPPGNAPGGSPQQ